MEDVDGAGLGQGEAALHDLLGGDAPPAPRVHRPHDVVGVAAGVDVGVHRGVVVAVGRAEVGLGAGAGQSLHDLLRPVQLLPALGLGHRRTAGGAPREGIVAVGMVDEVVALGHHAPHQVGVLLGPAPGDAEAGADAVGAQDVQDAGGIAGVGASVEGEGDHAPGGVAAADHRGAAARHRRGRGRGGDGGGGS